MGGYPDCGAGQGEDRGDEGSEDDCVIAGLADEVSDEYGEEENGDGGKDIVLDLERDGFGCVWSNVFVKSHAWLWGGLNDQ